MKTETLDFNRKITSNGHEVTILTNEVKAHVSEEFGVRFCLCEGKIYVIFPNGSMNWGRQDGTVEKRHAVNVPLNFVRKGDTVDIVDHTNYSSKWQVVGMDKDRNIIWVRNALFDRLVNMKDEVVIFNKQKIDGFKD